MATVRKAITLNGTQDAWIKSQIVRGSFTNDSEYIRDLLCRDQSQHDQLTELKQSIAEGLKSGPSDQSLEVVLSRFSSGRFRAINTVPDHRN